MAIEAFYKTGIHTLPAPYVQAIVHLTRINVEGTVDFLIDTGADNTCLHPGDIRKLAIPYQRMRPTTIVSPSGVGASFNYFREPGHLYFRDLDGSIRVFPTEIHICQRTPDKAIQGLPSIIGRDFLNLTKIWSNAVSGIPGCRPRLVTASTTFCLSQ